MHPVNDELIKELKNVKSTKLLSGIARLLGVKKNGVPTVEEAPLAGFFLRASDTLFALYVITPGKFGIFEMTASGDSLCVVIPVSRIRRVVCSQTNGVVVLTIEIDSDKQEITLRGEKEGKGSKNAALAETAGQENWVETSQFAAVGHVIPARYEITSTNEKEAGELEDFALSACWLIDS